jgi:hypothetical protein
MVVVSGSFLFGNSAPSAKDLGNSIFDFIVDSANGPVSLSTFKGKAKAFLLVNVASE